MQWPRSIPVVFIDYVSSNAMRLRWSVSWKYFATWRGFSWNLGLLAFVV
jgi:hypothetical protein